MKEWRLVHVFKKEVPVYLAFVLVTFTSAIFKPDRISQNTFFSSPLTHLADDYVIT